MEKLLKRSFSEMLFRKREELDLTQLKMAEKCFLSLRQYSDIENGLRLPSFESLINICIECNIDFNIFINEIVKKGYKGNDDKNSA